MTIKIEDQDVLVIIDPQNDFCPGGALAVPGGDEIMPLINEIAKKFKHVIITQDWHPQNQISFASNHEGGQPFTQAKVAYGDQTLWPDHCVQGTPGAEFHPALDVPHAEAIIRKGYNPGVDSYSAFLENDKQTSTGLAGYLKDRGIGKRCFFVGLAYDFCVGYSAIDHRGDGPVNAVLSGHESFIIKDATRAIDLNGSVEAAEAHFKASHIHIINSTDI